VNERIAAELMIQLYIILHLQKSLQHAQSAVRVLLRNMTFPTPPPSGLSGSPTGVPVQPLPIPSAGFCSDCTGQKIFPSSSAYSTFWAYQREIRAIDAQKGLSAADRNVDDGRGGEYTWRYEGKPVRTVCLQSREIRLTLETSQVLIALCLESEHEVIERIKSELGLGPKVASSGE
jgi:hypothetical protein